MFVKLGFNDGFLVAVIAIGYAASWYLNNPAIVYFAVILPWE